MSLFQGQFLFTNQKPEPSLPDWNLVEIDDYTLLSHPLLNYAFAKGNNFELHIIGDVYDWVNPFQTNQQIINSLVKNPTFDKVLEELAGYTGRFIMFYLSSDALHIVNDACAQHEVYYNNSFTTFGSQPKIIELIEKPAPPSNKAASCFFNSKSFLSKKVFYGDKTHVQNIKHLLPNHHLDIKNKRPVRNYPFEPLNQLSLSEVAGRASLMLKGFLKAIAHRERIALAVTAGYDSRVLFLASLELPCAYFVQKHAYMNNTHYDITIPSQLTKMFDKEFTIIPDIPKEQTVYPDDYKASIDFPRFLKIPSVIYHDYTYINGNISEIARNYFGYLKKPSARNLAFLNGYKNAKAVINEYQNWIDSNNNLFKANGYNLLDMFYWEEKMGNWAAKAKTEGCAMGQKFVSPFNSRLLLTILLSTDRKLRDSHNNVLYNRIIELLAPEALNIPINPCRKRNIIGVMQTLRLYNTYRYIGVKLQMLKP
ncbi:MAG: hypothetical protein PHD06_03180 [Bacteroidales bacterium]|jgi:hypothetical protein|nr:hypothetical protein [Bacteroidales bacterium]MDY0197787.1 hypothetical protein [Tenuifilaceae bacterium]